MPVCTKWPTYVQEDGPNHLIEVANLQILLREEHKHTSELSDWDGIQSDGQLQTCSGGFRALGTARNCGGTRSVNCEPLTSGSWFMCG